jgi:hypothetical protein
MNKIFTILNIILAALLVSYFVYDYRTHKTSRKEEQINLGLTMSETEEICLGKLDSIQLLNSKLQYSYDSLLLFCEPIKEEVIVPKKRSYTKKVSKVGTVKVKDTVLVDSLSKELTTCKRINESLTEALIAVDSIHKELYLANEELLKPRMSDLVNNDVEINTAAYVDSTLYNVKVIPNLSASLVRIKRPFLSITPRKFVLTAKENNKYALDAKPLVKELTRKQIPKVKGNHRVVVK